MNDISSKYYFSVGGKRPAEGITPTAPIVEELMSFSSFPDEVQLIILSHLPMGTVCNLLATGTVLPLHYFSLLSEEGKKYFNTIFDKTLYECLEPFGKHRQYMGRKAKEAFNRNANHRHFDYLLAGPNADRRYGQYHSIYVDPSLTSRLRTGTLPISVSQLRERHWRWHELRSQLRGPLPAFIGWLDAQILLVGSELGPTVTEYILYGSLPLTTAGLGVDISTIFPTDFKRFQDVVDIPYIALALHNKEVSVPELFLMTRGKDGQDRYAIYKHPRIEAAFSNGELKFDQLRKVLRHDSWYDRSLIRCGRSLQNGVLETLLQRNVLTLTQLARYR